MTGPAINALDACMEHPVGQLPLVGDALGTDCFVLAPSMQAGVMTPIEGDGSLNEDWHGRGAAALAPLDMEIVSVLVDVPMNTPGQTGAPPASQRTFGANDGMAIACAHDRDICVYPGERAEQGERAGTAGNHAVSRAPHSHIGGYRRCEPPQIRWDLRSVAALSRHSH